jgi:hypothetical protein
MKLSFSLFLLSFLAPLALLANYPNSRYSFGSVREGEVVEVECQFLNDRYDALEISHVDADCGLEVLSYTHGAISRFGAGSVRVRFTSKGRPGRVNKQIRLFTTGGTEEGGSLSVFGIVLPKGTAGEVSYKDTMGGLAFDHITEMVGQLRSDQDKEYTFRIKNVSKNVINILDKVEHKPAFSIAIKDKVLKPGQETYAIVKFIGKNGDASSYKRNQGIYEPIVFYTDEKQSDRKTLIINGSYERIYTAAELEAAPKAFFEVYDFQAGDIIQGQYLTYNFQLLNKGKSELKIESVKASCGCTATEPKENTVRAGGRTEIVARFDSNGKQGEQHKTITVVTNDPETPTIILHLRCNVITDPFASPDAPAGEHHPGDGHNH